MSLSLNDLPVEIVHGILLRVEVESVVRVCPLVCKLWRVVLQQNFFWLELARDNGFVPPPTPPGP